MIAVIYLSSSWRSFPKDCRRTLRKCLYKSQAFEHCKRTFLKFTEENIESPLFTALVNDIELKTVQKAKTNAKSLTTYLVLLKDIQLWNSRELEFD